MAESRRLADFARVEPWLASPLGPAITSRWTEPLLLHAVTRWYFPLSRLWAMAELRDPLLDGMRPRHMSAARLDQAVAEVAEARGTAKKAADAWEAAFFATKPPPVDTLRQLESKRRDAAHRFNLTRRLFVPLRNRVPSAIQWVIASEAAVNQRWSAGLEQPETVFAVPDPLPTVRQSATVTGGDVGESWVRFDSPRLHDTVHAHVYTPRNVSDPPTLIYGHGVGVEAEHWRGAIEETADLVHLGVRVIRAEAPWHGRRRPPGSFGGEPMFARGTDGSLDMVAAQASEIATLIAWARGTSRGPVAIGGMSLGALCAQVTLDHAKSWPAASRPDAAILCGTCDRMDAVLQQGTLPAAIGLPEALAAAGWSIPSLQRWRPLVEPRGDPAVDPAHIIGLIGRYDRVMPFQHARDFMARWRLPAANLFVRPQGHFGLALGLVRDPAPMRRLAEILHRLAG